MSRTQPLVSVLIPAYNAERTLQATIDSVRLQTYQNVEVIVIDDGSKDGTAALLERLSAEYPALRATTIPNGGASSARNRALSVARGEIVAPLDSDDIWHPLYLERLVGEMERLGPDCTMAYCYLRRIDEEGFVTETKRGHAASPRAFHQMLAFNLVGTGSAIVMRREAAVSVGGYDTSVGGAEDYLIQVRLAARGLVAAVPEYLVGYRTTATAQSTRRHEMSLWSRRVLSILEQEFPNADRRVMDRAVARSHADSFVHSVKAGRYLEGMKCLGTALARSPGETIETLRRKSLSASSVRPDTRPRQRFEAFDRLDDAGVGAFSSQALKLAFDIDNSTQQRSSPNDP